MATLPFSSSTYLLTSFVFLVLCISPVYSQTCKGQKLTSKTVYTNCSVLPTLDSYLSWTFNASNSSLSIAFTAKPATPDGWVSWAINPTGEGMIGAQAFIAFKSKGSVVVKTYNISTKVEESKLSFETWGLSAEESKDVITIYAHAKVPENAQKVNQTWQVGASVTNGKPDKHDNKPENLNAKGPLVLVGTQSSISPIVAPTSPNTPSNNNGISAFRDRIGLGFYFGLAMSLMGLIN